MAVLGCLKSEKIYGRDMVAEFIVLGPNYEKIYGINVEIIGICKL